MSLVVVDADGLRSSGRGTGRPLGGSECFLSTLPENTHSRPLVTESSITESNRALIF